jgi:hypothetical protein
MSKIGSFLSQTDKSGQNYSYAGDVALWQSAFLACLRPLVRSSLSMVKNKKVIHRKQVIQAEHP